MPDRGKEGKSGFCYEEFALSLSHTIKFFPSFLAFAAHGAGDLTAADSLTRDASRLLSDEAYEEASVKAAQALEIRTRLLGRDHPDTAAVLFLLARIRYAMGDYDGAESYGKRAWGIREKAFGAESKEVAESLTLLGRISLSAGRYKRRRNGSARVPLK